MTDLVMSLLDPSNSGEACKRLVLDAADKIAELQARLAECKRERDEAQEYISVCDDSFIEVCNERDTLRAQLEQAQNTSAIWEGQARRMRTERDEARAAIARYEECQWRPIEEAPRDGGVTVLPDGSAFFTASFPLPAEHWLYAPQCEQWDNERDTSADTPIPIIGNEQRKAVLTAMRWAIRGATMNGKEMDFDPDALALNAAYALCGPCIPAAFVDLPAPPAKGDEHEG